MSYTIQRLANLAGVTVRTLHYYDEIGLLKPAQIKENGYRIYEEHELLHLQQILFFREIDFPLEKIKRIMSDPSFSIEKALRDQRQLLELKKKRLTDLTRTIDKTLNKITKQNPMKDEKLYDGFSKEKIEKYAEEAKERWGHTEAYKQSQERAKKMSKGDMARIQKESDALMKEIAAVINKKPSDTTVQKLIDRHYNNLRNFYEPNLEMYRGLGNMYVDDSRFTAYFEKYAKGLAIFMRDAINAYCNNH
jgi:DNA-binding transcriptional MerR regulator